MSSHRHVAPGLVALAVVVTGVVATVPAPDALGVRGQYALATMAFAAVLWVTGAVPLALTAICIPIVLTITGVYPTFGPAVDGFADPVIALLFAGFVLARALQLHGVDRRVAYHLLHRFGVSARGLVLGVMVATAGLSMVVSNTATVAMMVPVVVGVVDTVAPGGAVGISARSPGGAGGEDEASRDDDTVDDSGAEDEEPRDDRMGDDAATPRGEASEASNLQIAMLLGVAYAASIGGVGTLIGTPPNAIVVGQLARLVGVEIGFVEWLAIGLPMVVVTLPVAWLLLTFVAYPPASVDVSTARAGASDALDEMGALSPAARRTIAIFGATAALWLLGGVGPLVEGWLPTRWSVTLFGGAGPSLLGPGGHTGLLYYVLVGLAAVPALVLAGVASFDELLAIDWSTLLLLGGGISLANALSDTGATGWLADVALRTVGGAPIVLVVLVLVGGTVLVGELASNTAMAAILAPLLVEAGPAFAGALGTTSTMAAVLLAITGAVAASYGFALPVATPPNAIVYGAGGVEREQMLRAGLLLDAVVVVLTTVLALGLALTVWPIVLG